MSNKNKLFLAVAIVTMIVAAVIGGTYAYWLWATNDAQRTAVAFTVQAGMSATLDGGATATVSNLAPVSSCTNSTYAMKKKLTLTYSNSTSSAASVKATLTVSDFVAPHGTPAAADLTHLHYALTTSGTNCTTSPVTGASGTFTTSGALIDNVEIKSVSASNNGTAVTGTQDYYLWVWIDSGYEHTNYGNVIDDPMQDITFTLTWTGAITNQ